MTQQEIKQLQEENTFLRNELNRLKDEMMRLISRNLDLSEKLEDNIELRQRVKIIREVLDGNIERQRNADLQDDSQLMAIIEIKVEQEHYHRNPEFDAAELAKVIGVSQERLNRLFRKSTIYRNPDAYIDNLRVIDALRQLREHPQYNIAVIAEESGFTSVRTLQRRIQEAIGMTPVEYRLMLTRDA